MAALGAIGVRADRSQVVPVVGGALVISGIAERAGEPASLRLDLYDLRMRGKVGSIESAGHGAFSFRNLRAGRYCMLVDGGGYFRPRIYVFDASPSGDPYFASVVALLHLDGADGSTAFPDVKGRVWTRAGDAQIDTGQSVFGGASLLLDGAGDYLTTTANTAPFVLGTKDFALEGRFKTAKTAADSVLFDFYEYGDGSLRGWQLYLSGGALTMWTTATVFTTPIATLVDNQWHRFKVARHQGVLRVWIDGVQVVRQAFTEDLDHDCGQFAIGAQAHDRFPDIDFAGHLDELRITVGSGRLGEGGGLTVVSPNA